MSAAFAVGGGGRRRQAPAARTRTGRPVCCALGWGADTHRPGRPVCCALCRLAVAIGAPRTLLDRPGVVLRACRAHTPTIPLFQWTG